MNTLPPPIPLSHPLFASPCRTLSGLLVLSNFKGTNQASFQVASHSSVPAVNQFHHVAGTFRQAGAGQVEAKLYLDGLCVLTTQLTGELSQTVTDTPITIGASNDQGEYFTGLVDEVTLYGRALWPEEVSAIYGAGANGKYPADPPELTAHPESVGVPLGQAAAFAVSATSQTPLSYQWTLDGMARAGATGDVCSIGAVGSGDEGTYRAVVANYGGSVVSGPAVLTVGPACLEAPSGLVSWWRAENSALDSGPGQHDGQITGGYASGKVGEAFSLNGTTSKVQLPTGALDLGLGEGFTVEGWVRVENWAFGPVAEWTGAGVLGVHFYVNHPSSGYLYANLVSTSGQNCMVQSGQPGLRNGEWEHVALTFTRSNGLAVLYLNGAEAGRNTFGALVPRTGGDFFLGHRPANIPYGPTYFKGRIDEASVYSRALTAQEVSAICGSGGVGKCIDSDSDGLLDAWEWRNFSSLGAQNAAGDADQDGYTNLEEFQNGTPPNAADPKPRVFEPKPGTPIL